MLSKLEQTAAPALTPRALRAPSCSRGEGPAFTWFCLLCRALQEALASAQALPAPTSLLLFPLMTLPLGWQTGLGRCPPRPTELRWASLLPLWTCGFLRSRAQGQLRRCGLGRHGRLRRGAGLAEKSALGPDVPGSFTPPHALHGLWPRGSSSPGAQQMRGVLPACGVLPCWPPARGVPPPPTPRTPDPVMPLDCPGGPGPLPSAQCRSQPTRGRRSLPSHLASVQASL